MIRNTSSTASPVTDFVARYWQNRVKITLTFLAIMAAMAGFTALTEPTYRSTAQLNIRVGRNSATLDPTITGGGQQFVAVADPREAEINALSDLIASRGVLEAVIADIGETKIRQKKEGQKGMGQHLAFLDSFNLNPFRVYSTQDDAVKKLSKKLKVTTMRNSNVIKLQYDANSPELAHDVLVSLIKHVQERHNQVNQTLGSHDYFQEELKQAKETLAVLENRRAELKNRTGLSEFGTQREKILERIRHLSDEIGDAKALLAATETEVETRTAMLKNLPASIVTEETTGEVNSVKDNMREELFRLETREKDLLSKFTDESIYVKQIREQISRAREVVNAESTPSKITRGVHKPNEEMQIDLNDAKAEQKSLQSKLAQLTEQLDTEKAQLQVINENEKEFVNLDREIRLAETQYVDFHKAYQQTLVDKGMEEQKITNINEHQTPTLWHTPASPQPLVNLALGLGLSFFASLGLVTMSSRRDDPPAVAETPRPQRSTPPVRETTPEVAAEHANGNGSNGDAEEEEDPLDDLVEARRPVPR